MVEAVYIRLRSIESAKEVNDEIVVDATCVVERYFAVVVAPESLFESCIDVVNPPPDIGLLIVLCVCVNAYEMNAKIAITAIVPKIAERCLEFISSVMVLF